VIIRARKADIPALATLMGASPLLRRYAVSERTARASLTEALRARDILLVAREGRETLGLSWVITTRALDRTAYLRLLLVAEGRQSRGVGIALLSRSEREARAAKCRHVALLVTKTNRRARTFYTRLGYRHVGDLPGFVRPRIDEALYVKSWRAARRA
jgi:ribosomal protein S18 acetylase RimI-like enzyme